MLSILGVLIYQIKNAVNVYLTGIYHEDEKFSEKCHFFNRYGEYYMGPVLFVFITFLASFPI